MSIFCTSWSCPSLSDSSLFLRLRDENKFTLLPGNEAMLSVNTPPEWLEPFKETCCNREGRSRPAPHGLAPADAPWASCLLAFFSSLDDSGPMVLKRELELNAPSDKGLCLQGPSRLVLLVKQKTNHNVHSIWIKSRNELQERQFRLVRRLESYRKIFPTGALMWCLK